MNEFKNWLEVTKGFYSYVISSGACYEIMVMHRDRKTPINKAKAVLFITGDWRTKGGMSFFSRDQLFRNMTVEECIEEAIKDLERSDPGFAKMVVHGPIIFEKESK